MAKKITAQFTLHMFAGKATPAPPVGPIMWQYGVNIGLAVKEFNDKTRDTMQKYQWVDIKVPAKFTVYADRTYDMQLLPPLSSHLILWKAKLKAGSAEPNKKKIGKISRADLVEIAEIKKPVMNTNNVESIVEALAWTAKSMGLEVIN